MKTMFIGAALVAAVTQSQALAAGAAAQPRMLPANTQVSGAAGKPGSVDLYSFMTIPGDTHVITVHSDSKKPVQVQLLDPAGNVVMHSSGVGDISIEAVASWGDPYSVAVIRAEPAARYSIERQLNVGTIQQFVMAHMAGYTRTQDVIATRCWTEPGKAIKIDFGDFVQEYRIDGNRMLGRYIPKEGKGSTSVKTMVVDGDAIAISEEEEGEVLKTSLSFNPSRLRHDNTYKFTGYLCGS